MRDRSKMRLSYIPELFWAVVNFITVLYAASTQRSHSHLRQRDPYSQGVRSFQTLFSTEATQAAIKSGQRRGYSKSTKRPVGSLKGGSGI